jgi:Zn-dependent protease with chaperone function
MVSRHVLLALLASTVLLAQPRSAHAVAQGVYESIPLLPKDATLVQHSAEVEDLLARRGVVVATGPEAELVARVGAALAPERPVDDYMRFRFKVIRSAVPNAFALQDGQIYVHTGLLALLENEAQLAAVLAHESMHVEGHHPLLDARQARKKQGGMVVLSILLGDIGNLINLALQKAMIGYERHLEEEADRRAVERVLTAGYDPREMPRVFELLDEDPEGDRLDVKPAWSNHPENEARAAYTREILGGWDERIAEAEAARGAPLRIDAGGFADTVRWAAKDSIELTIEADRPRTALSLAKRAVVRWPEDPDVHVLLGEAWRGLDARVETLAEPELTRKAKRHRLREYEKHTRQERQAMRRANPAMEATLRENWAKAEAAYREALRLDPRHAGALRGLGYLLEDRGELAEGGRHLAEYLRVAGDDATDREVVVRHLAEINEQLRAGGTP